MTDAERRRRAAAAAAAKAKSDADIARANADAARAAADATRAKAAADADIARIQAQDNAARLAAEAEARRMADQAAIRKIADDRRKAEGDARRMARERAWQLGINVTAPLAGMTAGYLLARGLKKKTEIAVRAQAPQLAALAKEIRTITPKRGVPSVVTRAKLAAAVSTSRRLNLVRSGPVGAVTAGLLLAEGGFARFVLAPSVENPVGREALMVIGTASVFAATTLVGKRIEQNRIAAVVRNSRDVMAVETARRLVTGGGTLVTRMAAGQTFRTSLAAGDGLKPSVPRAPRGPAPAASPTVSPIRRPLGGLRALVIGGTAAALGYTASRALDASRSAATSVAHSMSAAPSTTPTRTTGVVDVNPFTRVRNGVVERVKAHTRRMSLLRRGSGR